MPTPKAATMKNGVHHTQVRVRFGDTDPYGIVYFVSYFRYCHRAIEEYLRALGLPPEQTFKNVEEGFGLPIVEAWGRFRRASTYGDVLRIETRVQEIRTKAIIFRFEFFPDAGRDLLAEGTATLVAIDRHWQARELPARVKAALSRQP
ncbi:MAG TPA: thioesterase family protein [Desulfobaccales bacterium]|nr:thioesterase family protein [Desulfobaccales bacterium]